MATQYSEVMVNTKSTASTAGAATRESWLESLQSSLLPRISGAVKARVSVGFPSKAATSRANRRIGECWYPGASADGSHHIFISPLISDEMDVAGVLAHELIHVALGGKVGHRRPFLRAAEELGLIGPAKATTVGDQFKAWVAPILAEIGPYPHAALSVVGAAKKQSTRLLKAQCGDCGYTIRLAAKWAETGMPTCPCGGQIGLDGGGGEDEGEGV